MKYNQDFNWPAWLCDVWPLKHDRSKMIDNPVRLKQKHDSHQSSSFHFIFCYLFRIDDCFFSFSFCFTLILSACSLLEHAELQVSPVDSVENDWKSRIPQFLWNVHTTHCVEQNCNKHVSSFQRLMCSPFLPPPSCNVIHCAVWGQMRRVLSASINKAEGRLRPASSITGLDLCL